MYLSTRMLSLGISLVFVTSLLTGCGSSKQTTTEKQTITAQTTTAQTTAAALKKNITLKMWGGVPVESGPQEVVDSFNDKFAAKGIQVEYERFVNDAEGNIKLETNLLSGADIDIFVTYSRANIVKRVNGQMALDLSELIKRDKYILEEKLGEMTTDCYVDGKPYAIATNKNMSFLLVNKNMFDAQNIPIPTSWTLQEFKDIAKKLTKGEGQNKVYGVFLNSNINILSPALVFLKTAINKDLMFKNGGKESNFDNPLFEQVYQTVADMMLVDKSCYSHVDTVTQKLMAESTFLSEKVAMTTAPWLVRSIKDKEKYPHSFVTAFAPMPQISKDFDFDSGNLGDFLMIFQKSKKIEEAWEFIKWYTDNGMTPMIKYGRVPTNKSFSPEDTLKAALGGAEELFDKDSYKRVVLEPDQKYYTDTISANLPELTKILGEESEAIYTGKKTAKVGLADAKKRADEIISKSK